MVLNSFLGQKPICRMMLSHPAAQLQIPPTTMGIAQKYGHIFVRLFGYPLDITGRLRARTVLNYLPKNHGRLLEIGCSFGAFTFELARKGYQVTGLDVNPVTIELANKINEVLKLKNVRFTNMDFSDNTFPASEFDIVVTVEALEHIKYDRRFLDEIYRVLRKDGVLIVSVPYSDATTNHSPPVSSWHDFQGKPVTLGVPGELHFRDGYNPEKLTSLLNLCGFKVVQCSCTPSIRALPKSMILFPMSYILALILGDLSKGRAKVTVLAKKESNGSSLVINGRQ